MIISSTVYGPEEGGIDVRVRTEEVGVSPYPVAIYFTDRSFVMLTESQVEKLHFDLMCALHEIDTIKG